MTATPTPKSPSAWKAFLISGMGTAMEFYDFSIYGLAAALVFPEVFFPQADPWVGSLIAFATFGTGFLARPLGGFVFGHFGDRVGRRPVLILTMLIMGISTMLIGLLPGQAKLGSAAVVILVVLRLVQGFAAGGEWGGASLAGIESAPVGRRGLWGSFTSVGIGVGTLIGTIAFSLVSAHGHEWLVTIGWRIPFVAGCLLVLVGLLARLSLPAEEPPVEAVPEDAEGSAADGEVKVPLWVAVRSYPREVICAIGISFGYNTLAMMIAVFFLSYTTSIGYSESESLLAQNVSLVFLIVCALVFGALSDRWGRRAVMIFGSLAGIVVFLLIFPALALRSVPLMLLMFTLNAIFAGATQGPIPAFLGEQFPRAVRFSGISTTYQVGAALGGGTASVISSSLLLLFHGNPIGVAAYAVLVSLIMTVCSLGLRETSRMSMEQIDSGGPRRVPAQSVAKPM